MPCRLGSRPTSARLAASVGPGACESPRTCSHSGPEIHTIPPLCPAGSAQNGTLGVFAEECLHSIAPWTPLGTGLHRNLFAFALVRFFSCSPVGPLSPRRSLCRPGSARVCLVRGRAFQELSHTDLQLKEEVVEPLPLKPLTYSPFVVYF